MRRILKPQFIIIVAAALVAVIAIAAFVGHRLKGIGSDFDQGSAADKENAVNGNVPVLAEHMPPFLGIAAWLNSPPIDADDLRGKVVLIDFWTYTCINCIRTLPYVTSWDAKYGKSGLAVIGVHTPEFEFEKSKDNVRSALVRYGIRYPVALDNDYSTWNAYANRYWPAKYLFDVKGRLRYVHFGEGEYEATERAIQSVLNEAGMRTDVAPTKGDEVQFEKIGTRETYLGYGRMEFYGGDGQIVKDGSATYSEPAKLAPNTFALFGDWTVGSERAILDKPNGGIVMRYSASVVNLVLAPPPGRKVRAEVTLDGAPVPEGMRGSALTLHNGKTVFDVGASKLYELIDAGSDYAGHVIRIIFLDAGAEAFAFTFG